LKYEELNLIYCQAKKFYEFFIVTNIISLPPLIKLIKFPYLTIIFLLEKVQNDPGSVFTVVSGIFFNQLICLYHFEKLNVSL